jgi:hypothetical protein
MHDCNLKIRNIIVLAIALTPLLPLHAQDDCGDECRINSNLAMVVNVPVNPTAQAVGTGWGIVGGAGYNFNKRNAVIGEFMWNRVYPSGGLEPLQATLASSNLNGNTNLFTLTGNYRFELRGRLLGTYLIGGGGWYSRNTWALESSHLRHRHSLHPGVALVGIHLHVGEGHCQPDRDNF